MVSSTATLLSECFAYVRSDVAFLTDIAGVAVCYVRFFL